MTQEASSLQKYKIATKMRVISHGPMYTLQPMGSLERKNDNTGTMIASHDRMDDRRMQQRWKTVRDSWQKYRDVMDRTGFGNTEGLHKTERWIEKTQFVDDRSNLESIVHREEFFAGYGRTAIEEGVEIHDKFYAEMRRGEKYISKNSFNRWVNERYLNEYISIQEKKYWIERQMPSFVDSWIKIGREHDEFIKKPECEDVIALSPDLAILKDRECFLDLHFDIREGLMAKAQAALLACKKMQLDLYVTAESKLQSAVEGNFLANGKVGIWLKRIFQSNADSKKIRAFVTGSSSKTLSDLMVKWKNVKDRYDDISSRFKTSGDEELPRGIQLLSSSQFLSLHYTQRLRYVEEMEQRLGKSPDLSHEPDFFILIRHAIDTEDWFEAALLIEQAKQQSFPVDARARLDSMSRYVVQFSPRQGSNTLTNVDQAKLRLDHLVGQLGQSHSELQPMILDLLHGPHANRSIAQFRWIVYNYDWCTVHGYLNYEKARQGASRENEQRTRERTDRGEDTGRNDVIGATTADSQCIRKREYATHRATFHHVDISNGAAVNTTAKWLKEEQDPRDLYWRTFIGNEKGVPKSYNWHKDLFMILTEMRVLTRVVGNAGFMYNGTNEGLKPLAT